MDKIIRLTFICLLLCAFLIPRSAYASNGAIQANSINKYFQTFSISNLFFSSHNDWNNHDIEITSREYDQVNHREDWWKSFLNWWCDGSEWPNTDNHIPNCRDDNGFSNDNGCLNSDEIWKIWYCR